MRQLFKLGINEWVEFSSFGGNLWGNRSNKAILSCVKVSKIMPKKTQYSESSNLRGLEKTPVSTQVSPSWHPIYFLNKPR